ncbi:MAG: hypothetical protein KAT66_10450 [Candidatus Lokiarchaeota archaeon]|nr:hypothetical protein [Candidatus Lokiarchaeota archaeon]
MFRRRWTSASVTDWEDLCWTGVSSLVCGSLPDGCSVFLGFKGGLG